MFVFINVKILDCLFDIVSIIMWVFILWVCNECKVFKFEMFFIFRFKIIKFGCRFNVLVIFFELLFVFLIIIKFVLSLRIWCIFLCIKGWLLIKRIL